MQTCLLLDLYELTMAQSYLIYKRNAFATFDLFVRGLPENRTYLVACGLEDALNYIKGLRFSREDLEYLKRQKIFSADFLNYLMRLDLKGISGQSPKAPYFLPMSRLYALQLQLLKPKLLKVFC